MSDSSGRVEAIYYELDMRTEGMEAGKAKSAAIFRDIEILAAKSGKSIDEVAAAVNRVGAGPRALGAAAKGLSDVAEKSGHATVGLHAFLRPLESLATEAIGANAQIGNLASKLATLGLGTGVTLLILGGLAAIAKAWDVLTEGAHKAQKAAEDFANRMLQLGDLQKREGAAGALSDLGLANANKGAAQDRLDEASRKFVQASLHPELPVSLALATRELAKARAELTQTTDIARIAEIAYTKARQDEQAAQANALGQLLLTKDATSGDRTAAANLLHNLRSELDKLGSTLPLRRAQIEGK